MKTRAVLGTRVPGLPTPLDHLRKTGKDPGLWVRGLRPLSRTGWGHAGIGSFRPGLDHAEGLQRRPHLSELFGLKMNLLKVLQCRNVGPGLHWEGDPTRDTHARATTQVTSFSNVNPETGLYF